MSDIRIKMAKDLRDMSDMVGDLHWMAAKAIEDLVKKDGEISKRDARIAEMQERFDSSAHRTSLIGRLEIENDQLRAELAALKPHGNYAPASVVWIDAHHVIEGNNPSFIKDVALVSAERTSETQIPLARLTAAPVQQVSVPDGLEVVGWYRMDDRKAITPYPSVCATWHKMGVKVGAAYSDSAHAIIDGLRGEVADLRSMLATVSKAGLRVRTERDQHAKRIGELEGLLREAHDTYRAAIHWEDLRGTMKRIDAALSAGKEGE